MKRVIAICVWILLCNFISFASKPKTVLLGQFYDGSAKSRAEVVWIRLGYGVSVHAIDGWSVNYSPTVRTHSGFWRTFPGDNIVELLPGKHLISVGFFSADSSVTRFSSQDVALQIDAKAGENYFVHSVGKSAKTDDWNPIIEPEGLDPENGSDVERGLLGRITGVTGVVQSVDNESRPKHFVLAIPESNQVKEFISGVNRAQKANRQVPLSVGQKLKVFSSSNSPDNATEIILIE